VGDGRVVRVVEHDLLLGGEVPEERHLAHPGGRGDRGHRRLVVALLGEEPQRHRTEALSGPLGLAHP
jgi:hypothetical protein